MLVVKEDFVFLFFLFFKNVVEEKNIGGVGCYRERILVGVEC